MLGKADITVGEESYATTGEMSPGGRGPSRSLMPQWHSDAAQASGCAEAPLPGKSLHRLVVAGARAKR
jgi:hypothetical protein